MNLADQENTFRRLLGLETQRERYIEALQNAEHLSRQEAEAAVAEWVRDLYHEAVCATFLEPVHDLAYYQPHGLFKGLKYSWKLRGLAQARSMVRELYARELNRWGQLQQQIHPEDKR